MNATTAIARRTRGPQWQRRILRAAEVLIALGAVIALLAVVDPGPIHFMLFLVMGQGCIVVGVALYLMMTIIDFKMHHGVSRVHVGAGQTIFRQGDPGDFVYFIINGEVEIIREDPEHGERVLSRLGPGQYFGEMALVSDAPRSATVRTLTPVDVATMGRVDFTALYTYLPDLRRSLDKAMRRYKSR